MRPVLWFLLVFIASEVSSEALTKPSSNAASKAPSVELSKASSQTLSKEPTETSPEASPKESEASSGATSEASPEASSEASTEESEASSGVSSEASPEASSEASTEESSEASTGEGASSEEASLSNELADAIYEHQKFCDAFVGEVVVNAVEKGTKEMPKPDEKYLKCMKKLDKQKRTYIKSFLVGINYQSKGFSMRLSNEKEVTLPFPSEESSLEGTKLEYDIQQQLCMTNQLCMTISTKINIDNVGDLEEQKMYVERCLKFLNFLKLKYIDVNKQEKNEFEKDKRLTIICGDGEVALPLPLRTERKENQTPISSMTPEETQDSGPSVGKIKKEQTGHTETSPFVLADAIFDKQKECDSYISEKVLKTVQTINSEFPTPDERYVQCVETLNEYKREYIKHFLLGLNYYSKMFPMVLSNKQLVTLPVPLDKGLSTKEDSDFDIQQELCVTNKLCITLVSKRFLNLDADDLNDQKLRVGRCLDFLNDLKQKYIKFKHIDESELKKGQGLSLMCTYGEITLALPEKKDHIIFSDNPISRFSKIPKNKELFITKKNKHLINGDSVLTYSSSNDSNVDGKKEIRYRFDKLSKKIITVTRDSDEDISYIETPEKQHDNGELMIHSKTEETAEEQEDKPIEKPKSPTTLEETETLPDKNNAVAINVPAITKTMPEINIPQEQGSENVQLSNNHIKVLSTNSDSNNLPIQANKQVMERELVTTSPKEQGFGLIDDGKRRRQIKSLVDNIVLIEKDCQELLEFGERLFQNKILSSLMNLETQYHECVKKLDTLKKIYIEKQKLDVTSHKHFFPITLSTGESKLVSLPVQFLRLGLEEPRPSSKLIPDDVFELADSFRKNSRSGDSIRTREPFDNPAFITNEKFLKSLQEEFSAEGISTLSKLASALHISGSYKDEKIAE